MITTIKLNFARVNCAMICNLPNFIEIKYYSIFIHG